MKLLTTLQIITLLALTCAPKVLARESSARENGSESPRRGGIGDGGGNGIGSTPEEVIEGLTNAKLELGAHIHLAASDSLNPLNPALVNDKTVQKVLKSWLEADGDSEALVNDISSTEYKPQDADCVSDAGTDHDAKTAFKRGAPVCFSTSRLTRFPKWTLPAELVALAAHEHAHHFGFGEAEARAVQEYIFSAFGLLQIHMKANQFFHTAIDNYKSRVKSGYSPAGGPAAIAFAKTICRSFYSIEGQAIAFNIEVFKRGSTLKPVCDPESFDPDVVEKRLRDLIAASIQNIK